MTSFVGTFSDPERQAFFNPNNHDVLKRPLYIVTFSASALWADGQVPIYPKHREAKFFKASVQVPGPEHSVTAEVYQPWLEAIDSSTGSLLESDVELDLHLVSGASLDHGDHVHDQRLEVEQEAIRRQELTYYPCSSRRKKEPKQPHQNIFSVLEKICPCQIFDKEPMTCTVQGGGRGG